MKQARPIDEVSPRAQFRAGLILILLYFMPTALASFCWRYEGHTALLALALTLRVIACCMAVGEGYMQLIRYIIRPVICDTIFAYCTWQAYDLWPGLMVPVFTFQFYWLHRNWYWFRAPYTIGPLTYWL